jgi:hypothetical protein
MGQRRWRISFVPRRTARLDAYPSFGFESLVGLSQWLGVGGGTDAGSSYPQLFHGRLGGGI